VATQTKPEPCSAKDEGVLEKEFRHSGLLRVVAVIAIVAMCILILGGLFAPGLRYSLVEPPAGPLDVPTFVNELESLVDSKLTRNNSIDVIPNGENFYTAEIDAMRQAQHSINIEAYIFHKGQIARQVVEVLTERAKAGVHVNLVMDSVGSFSTRSSFFRPLKAAGGKVHFYHRLRLHNWFRANNRTHREITIVDGSVAFVGGAGYADWWAINKKREPRWRDTVVRVRGDAVRGLQGTFIENWLEASGEILAGPDYFPPLTVGADGVKALVITSSPSSGGSTRSRILFQTLLAAAQKSIYITTPYFLPDESMRAEMVRARQRGVTVNILVPGKKNDHALTYSSGRRAYGDLLKAGANIYEYEPAMIHAKIAIIDGMWSVLGSANIDNRSFGINDEVNLAALDAHVAATLTANFDNDVAHATRITLQTWQRRSVWERIVEWVGWIVERQQ
jgi:cardiolipin synthase A/B